MNVDLKEVISAMFVLILVYLFVSNGTNANQLITGIGSTVTNLTKTLQGR